VFGLMAAVALIIFGGVDNVWRTVKFGLEKFRVSETDFTGVGTALLIVGVVLTVLSKGKPLDLLNPLSSSQKTAKVPGAMQVVGFLPTWMIGKTKTYGSEIDQLVFSSVGCRRTGA